MFHLFVTNTPSFIPIYSNTCELSMMQPEPNISKNKISPEILTKAINYLIKTSYSNFLEKYFNHDTSGSYYLELGSTSLRLFTFVKAPEGRHNAGKIEGKKDILKVIGQGGHEMTILKALDDDKFDELAQLIVSSVESLPTDRPINLFATSALRNSGKAAELDTHIERVIKEQNCKASINLRVLSEEEEALLGLTVSAMSAKEYTTVKLKDKSEITYFNPRELISLEIGSGSAQIAFYNSNGELTTFCSEKHGIETAGIIGCDKYSFEYISKKAKEFVDLMGEGEDSVIQNIKAIKKDLKYFALLDTAGDALEGINVVEKTRIINNKANTAHTIRKNWKSKLQFADRLQYLLKIAKDEDAPLYKELDSYDADTAMAVYNLLIFNEIMKKSEPDDSESINPKPWNKIRLFPFPYGAAEGMGLVELIHNSLE